MRSAPAWSSAVSTRVSGSRAAQDDQALLADAGVVGDGIDAPPREPASTRAWKAAAATALERLLVDA